MAKDPFWYDSLLELPANRQRVFVWVGLLLALGGLFLIDMRQASNPSAVGCSLGWLFAQAQLTAAWTVFGPASLKRRVRVSFLWMLLLLVVIVINVTINGGGQDAIVLLGSCLLGQWLLLQFPFWVLASVCGLRLCRIDDADTRRVRFGISHLLIVTVVASVILGMGRIIAANMSIRSDGPFLILLAAASMVWTVPLLLAAFMRMAIPSILSVLVPTVVAISFFSPQALEAIVSMYETSATLILLVAVIIRVNGYHFYTGVTINSSVA